MAASKEMQSFATRLQTFLRPHHLSKRRASSQQSKKRGAGNTIEWPHKQPSPEDLARAGFHYRPVPDSTDNVQCFLCAVKLDGWEAEDDPLKEHLGHSPTCHWAINLSAGTAAQQDDHYDRDPMDGELVEARKGTFEGWPHESKRGWKCKVNKMLEAGWCFDPAPDGEVQEEEAGDGVTCFYCSLSLDGWEPKDDPLEEHRRRSPECAFFALVEKSGSAAGGKKGTAKGKGKKSAAAAGRSSTASKASRLSTQSAMSTFSEVPDFADLGPDAGEEVGGADDSILSTATTASQMSTTGTKGKKKGGRANAAAKGTKGRKRANTVDSEAETAGPMYLDYSAQVAPQATQEQEEEIAEPVIVEEAAHSPPPAKKTRKGTRGSKQQPPESSIMEISSMEVAAPAKKATRGRQAKAQTEPEPEPEVDEIEVSAQLQEELERSMSFNVDDEATPHAEPKRGVKRTSDGFRKKTEEEDVSAVMVEFPVPPKPAPVAKGRKGRKASKQVEAESLSQSVQEDDVLMSEPEPEPVKPKKSKAQAKGKGKKASSTRSSRSSKATITADSALIDDEQEDLERDEREIEAELARIEAEEAQSVAIAAEQEKTAEFESSPSHSHSHAQKHVQQIQHLEQGLQAELKGLGDPGQNLERYVAAVATSPQPPVQTEVESVSPSGSDKENQPSSIIRQPSAAEQQQQQLPAIPNLSPTKTQTTRIPLAPGTPNRPSPSKQHTYLSPSKHIAKLASTQPWTSIDLDTVLLASPQPTPRTLSQRFAAAAGDLTSPEKHLTVEGWVRWRAEQAEADLRRRCEELVGGFEREGVRALGAVGGVVVQ